MTGSAASAISLCTKIVSMALQTDGREGFRVENDIRRHFDVCVFVDIHVAVTDAGLDDRYLGVFHHGADKPLRRRAE